VFVLGEVASPGRFEYDPKDQISVLKALSLAGGVGPFAARTRIQVRETVGGTEILRLFDYDSVEEGLLNSSADLSALQNGAVIIVPERGLFE
jgi:polysaccharide export outer membrane protein